MLTEATTNMSIEDFFKWEQATKDTIDVKKIYVDMADDLVAGVLLSQIVFWFLPNQHGKTKLRIVKQGVLWLAKGRDEWWDECRIKARQFDTSVKKLEDRGLLEKKVMKFDGETKVHIRILWDSFLAALQSELDKLPGVNPDLQIGKSVGTPEINEIVNPELHVKTLVATENYESVNPELRMGESGLSKSVNPLTEITTEILKEEEEDLFNITETFSQQFAREAKAYYNLPQPWIDSFLAYCPDHTRYDFDVVDKALEILATQYIAKGRTVFHFGKLMIDALLPTAQANIDAYYNNQRRKGVDPPKPYKPKVDFTFYNWLEND